MPDQRPDSGVLFAKDNKRSEKSPDYSGEIAIDLRNLTAVRQEGGLHIFRLSGWKRQGRSGKTFLSIAVDRYEKRDEAPQPKPNPQTDEDDFSF